MHRPPHQPISSAARPLDSSGSRRAALLAAVVCALVLVAGACRPGSGPSERPSPHRGPILWITIDALRADVLGAFGGDPELTPNLDALAAEADWAEPAVAPSSWTVPSMASLFTGLQPFRHGNWHSGRTVLSAEHLTLPEALQALGFQTAGFRSNTWLRQRSGYAQGFDQFSNLAQGGRAAAHIASLDGGPHLVWAHVLPPHAPYVLYPELRDRLAGAPAELPERINAKQLEPYFDPERDLPAELRDQAWALYRSNVAHADRVAGQLLDALRQSGHWDDALVIVTSDHGEEFGESGQVTHGGNLSRVLLEVPLIIKLPEGSRYRLRPRSWVANARLFATVVELCGGSPGADVLPSLLSDVDPPALSELYLGNGINQVSLLVDGEQALWRARFAPSEPRYYDARLAGLGLALATPLEEEPAAIFGRLAAAFAETPPLTGRPGDAVETTVRSWTHPAGAGAPGGAELPGGERPPGRAGPRTGPPPVALIGALEREWLRWNGPERPPREAAPMPRVELTPEEREELEALGYVVEEDG
ncbi:MAG TPA: sulfatase [Thermoanaerobaculia bacterium]|nr:sulfatase [Thermoanaerobaculia bacterium]